MCLPHLRFDQRTVAHDQVKFAGQLFANGSGEVESPQPLKSTATARDRKAVPGMTDFGFIDSSMVVQREWGRFSPLERGKPYIPSRISAYFFLAIATVVSQRRRSAGRRSPSGRESF